MFVEKIKTPGLAQLSYVVGDGDRAAVVDPRRDVDVYIDISRREGAQITHILETHRNEDLISGASALAEITGATVLHGPNPAEPIAYAQTIREGEGLTLGNLGVSVLETPGHTDDSVSYVLHDRELGGEAIGVFTGDALFVGDVGRTDFYPDRPEEVAGLLFDSLQKLAALGDQAIIYPAHGAGSVCGAGMADREFSTIGTERQTNRMLRIEDRDEFIRRKTAEEHYQPPYFRLMEQMNTRGGNPASDPLAIKPLAIPDLKAGMDDGCQLVDVRSPESFAGAHIDGALSLPVGLVTTYGGWLLDPEDQLIIVADNLAQAREAEIHFSRIGYDRVAGAFTDGMAKWAAAGEPFESMATVSVSTVKERLGKPPENWVLLDVRKGEEFRGNAIDGARHIFLGHLPGQLAELDRDASYTVLCGSGMRAMVGGAVLRKAGWRNVDVFMGSMGAWTNTAE